MKTGTVQNYTRNRNADAARAAIEAQEHAGELVARSLDGRQTIAYGASVDALRQELSRLGLAMSDVVIESVENDVIDVAACRNVSEASSSQMLSIRVLSQHPQCDQP